jgi:hypothetical protein
MGIDTRMGLPLHIDRLIMSPHLSESIIPLYAVVTRKPEQNSFDAEVIDGSGNRLLLLSGYHTISLPNSIDAQKIKALRSAMTLDLIAA